MQNPTQNFAGEDLLKVKQEPLAVPENPGQPNRESNRSGTQASITSGQSRSQETIPAGLDSEYSHEALLLTVLDCAEEVWEGVIDICHEQQGALDPEEPEDFIQRNSARFTTAGSKISLRYRLVDETGREDLPPAPEGRERKILDISKITKDLVPLRKLRVPLLRVSGADQIAKARQLAFDAVVRKGIADRADEKRRENELKICHEAMEKSQADQEAVADIVERQRADLLERFAQVLNGKKEMLANLRRARGRMTVGRGDGVDEEDAQDSDQDGAYDSGDSNRGRRRHSRISRASSRHGEDEDVSDDNDEDDDFGDVGTFRTSHTNRRASGTNMSNTMNTSSHPYETRASTLDATSTQTSLATQRKTLESPRRRVQGHEGSEHFNSQSPLTEAVKRTTSASRLNRRVTGAGLSTLSHSETQATQNTQVAQLGEEQQKKDTKAAHPDSDNIPMGAPAPTCRVQVGAKSQGSARSKEGEAQRDMPSCFTECISEKDNCSIRYLIWAPLKDTKQSIAFAKIVDWKKMASVASAWRNTAEVNKKFDLADAHPYIQEAVRKHPGSRRNVKGQIGSKSGLIATKRPRAPVPSPPEAAPSTPVPLRKASSKDGDDDSPPKRTRVSDSDEKERKSASSETSTLVREKTNQNFHATTKVLNFQEIITTSNEASTKPSTELRQPASVSTTTTSLSDGGLKEPKVAAPNLLLNDSESEDDEDDRDQRDVAVWQLR